MKRFTIVVSILMIIALFFFLPIFQVLAFTETRTNNPRIYYINVAKDKQFNIRFTHSIHLSDVIETYEVTDDMKIKLISMEYEDVAVGMPAHADEGQTLSYENGKYKMYYSDTYLDSFVLYIGDIDMDLFFYYEEREYDLKKTLKRGSSYKFEVKNISLYDKMKGVPIRNESR